MCPSLHQMTAAFSSTVDLPMPMPTQRSHARVESLPATQPGCVRTKILLASCDPATARVDTVDKMGAAVVGSTGRHMFIDGCVALVMGTNRGFGSAATVDSC